MNNKGLSIKQWQLAHEFEYSRIWREWPLLTFNTKYNNKKNFQHRRTHRNVNFVPAFYNNEHVLKDVVFQRDLFQIRPVFIWECALLLNRPFFFQRSL